RKAQRPDELAVRVFVVDNNSSDSTRDVVLAATEICGEKPRYLFEPVQGRSHALNRALQAASGDLVAFLDDDEEIAPTWLTTVHEVFADADVHFISGPYKPNWGAEPPAWLPKSYPAVIGWIESGDRV